MFESNFSYYSRDLSSIRSTPLFVYEASNVLVDDINIHFVIMRFKG